MSENMGFKNVFVQNQGFLEIQMSKDEGFENRNCLTYRVHYTLYTIKL